MINKKRLIELTRQLIRINSENPPGNEQKIAGFVKNYLGRLNIEAKIYEFKKGRSNVVANLKGNSNKNSLLITPHLDTVTAGKNWKFPPFSAKIAGPKIYGLGASDCKGNLAVAMEVINSLREDNMILDYELLFAATADEETGSNYGLIPLLNRRILKPSAALVLDADDFEIVVAQKGLFQVKVIIHGKRAHGAYPWEGINAINIAVHILRELISLNLGRKLKNKYLRGPTMNIGRIKGGDQVNVVSDLCEFELDFRFLPGQAYKTIEKKLKDIINKYSKKFEFEIIGSQEPYVIDKTHPLVDNLLKVYKKMKLPIDICGSEGATTITFFQDKGIPAAATGFGCKGCAHTVNEYAKVENLYKGACGLEEYLKSYRFNN
ncbi:MAG: M20 family metallopeptidase [Candidatus Omnitrophota bacterium]